MPRSIVARTSLSILVLAVIMGLLFSITASWRVRAAVRRAPLPRCAFVCVLPATALGAVGVYLGLERSVAWLSS